MIFTETICKAAGWMYCPDHDKPKWRGTNPCGNRHSLQLAHAYWCGYGLDSEECICGGFREERCDL